MQFRFTVTVEPESERSPGNLIGPVIEVASESANGCSLDVAALPGSEDAGLDTGDTKHPRLASPSIDSALADIARLTESDEPRYLAVAGRLAIESALYECCEKWELAINYTKDGAPKLFRGRVCDQLQLLVNNKIISYEQFVAAARAYRMTGSAAHAQHLPMWQLEFITKAAAELCAAVRSKTPPFVGQSI